MYTPYAGDVGNITAQIGEIPYLATEMDTIVIQICVQPSYGVYWSKFRYYGSVFNF